MLRELEEENLNKGYYEAYLRRLVSSMILTPPPRVAVTN